MTDAPKSLSNEEERIQRASFLKERHMVPLVHFVRQIRKDRDLEREIPDFDPLDGGVAAECLFVFEAPGPKAVESGFISRNNNDQRANNFFEFNKKVGLERKRTVSWNIVPWYLGDGRRIRHPRAEQRKDGLRYLHKLLNLLPKLRVIVLIGQHAQAIQQEIKTKINILTGHHPSPMWVNRNPKKNKQIIIKELEKVRNFLGANWDSNASLRVRNRLRRPRRLRS